MDFFENSTFVFHTYYNYDANRNPTPQQVFTTTVGDVCDAYNVNNSGIIDMVLAFEAPSSGGAKPAWFGYHAPAKKRK